MTLYDYIKQTTHDSNENGEGIAEYAVTDVDYDIETYFYYEGWDADDWAIAKNIIAKHLNVVEVIEPDRVVVDLSPMIERNINNGTFEKLFIRNNVDDIMDDIMAIFSGYVSEEWLMEFAESLV